MPLNKDLLSHKESAYSFARRKTMVIKTINTVVKQWLGLLLILIFYSLSQGAYAMAGFNFGQSANPVGIESKDTSNATVIAKKSVTCPKNGYLLVTGGGQFHAYPGTTVLSYDITRDSTAPYAMDSLPYIFYVPGAEFTNVFDRFIQTIQQVDSCQRGQTITYRLVGSISDENTGDSFDSTVSGSLVIQFFDVLI
jgi:hypothetical protein